MERTNMGLGYWYTVYNGTFQAELLYYDLMTGNSICENSNKRPKIYSFEKENDIFENGFSNKVDSFFSSYGWGWLLERTIDRSHIKLIFSNCEYPVIFLVQKDWVINYFGHGTIKQYIATIMQGDIKTYDRFLKKPKHKIDIIVLLLLIRNSNHIWKKCISIDVLKNHIIPYSFYDDVVIVSYCADD
jgi:hypothetical protein